MTIDISNNDPRISYSVAQGVTQTSFTVPFEFFDDSDVNVYVDGTLKTITTDYTISGGGGSTGTVTISVTGASGGSVVVLTRDITIERTTDFTAGADINRAALNTQLDTLTAIAADVKDRAGLALSYNDRTVGVPTELPDVAGLKGRYLAFNISTGAPEAGATTQDVNALAPRTADIGLLADIQDGTIATNAITTVASISSDVVTLAPISADVTTVAGISANVTTVAGISADVTTVAGVSADVTAVAAIDTDVTAVAADATDIGIVATDLTGANTIGTVAGIAGNVTTVAGISADVTTVAGDEADIGIVATDIADVSTVAGIAANVTTVAGVSADVTAVAGISADVTTVAGISADVTTVAADGTDIGVVAGISADVTAVAADATDIGIVATDITDVSTVAGISSDVTAVAADATDIGTVASSIADVSTVAGIAANVTTVAGVSANVTTVAGISADVTTAAANVTDITNFADVYIGPSATDPTLRNDGSALQEGDLYFNTADDVMKVFDGSIFVAAFASLSGALLATNNLSDLTDASVALDNLGVTSTAAELNILDGVTATTAELNILDGVTATTAELNILDGVTATTAELNILDGVTATTAELNFVDGVTSAIQTQLNDKPPVAREINSGTGILGGGNLTANRTLSIDISSQAEAETGTDNAHVMTPLRVKQAIDANVPPQVPYSVNLINTLTPTGVSTVTISGLAAGKSYFIELQNLRINVGANRLLFVSFNDGSGFGTAFAVENGDLSSLGLHGILSFYKPSGLFNSSLGKRNSGDFHHDRRERTIPPSSSKNSNATTSIRISNQTNTSMTATAIRVYEVT